MHCKFQVQKYSVLTQCKQQCAELFLNKLEFDSSKVHIMKRMAECIPCNFGIGHF
jgi:hypothetical protein